MRIAPAAFTIIASAILGSVPVLSQTYSSCNPLYTTCPADTALGKTINVDFRNGAVDSFTAVGNPTYDSSGASFTISKSGDAPTLTSVFYIMFGHVSFTMKSAPGAGIVSTLVLESDDLDEIDLEWLGADSTQMQSNYFGKGEVTTYNRGAFHDTPENQGSFITYEVDWTQDQISWTVDGTVVRILTPAAADANQYPQTPMRVKFGAWSGGDPSNPEGTIQWARGPTNYADGPFTMVVQDVTITDYSTGTSYSYSDMSGNWGSIVATDGQVNGNANGDTSAVTTAAPSITSSSPSIPAGIGSNGDTATMTGWPWVAESTTLVASASPTVDAAGVPSGWVISSSGKIVPANSSAKKTQQSITMSAIFATLAVLSASQFIIRF